MKRPQSDVEPPKLANRRANRTSAFKMGRTIAEKREKLETKSERELARKKDKNRQTRRLVFTVIGFLLLIIILIAIAVLFVRQQNTVSNPATSTITTKEPRSSAIQIVDEAATGGNHQITSRMHAYIVQLEGDLIDLGYQPTKAVIPANSIREVDIYINGHPGFFKTHIDRDSAVTAEDIDRMVRYLAGQGITEYEYVDVRISGKAYWK